MRFAASLLGAVLLAAGCATPAEAPANDPLKPKTTGQALAQMALAWVLRDPRVTSALVGASSVAQLEDSLGALQNLTFTDEELARIDTHAVDGNLNIWAGSSEA
jgi:aryl-alcohol dehydrogenase-like predicted oxidoreductase